MQADVLYEKEKLRSTQPMDSSILGAYKVGGNHVRWPTSQNRDSPHKIDYGPKEL